MTKTKQAEALPSEIMEAAGRVRTFLDGGPIPNFIGYAVVDAIREASRRTGAPMPDVHPERGYDLDALAYLFEVASTIDLRSPGFVVTPTQALAAHLAAVMAHPETPTKLHNVMADELNSMGSDVNFYTPDMIERMLESSGRREAQQEGGQR